MDKQTPRKPMDRQEADRWRRNWKKACEEGQRLTKDTPPGFLLDRATVEKVLAQGDWVKGLWVSFGKVDEQGEMKLILQAYAGDGEPRDTQKTTEEEDEVYDDFGTCCPKKG